VIRAIIFFLFIFFDLFSKFLVKNNLTINQSIELNSFFDLVYVQNYGVSFGMLSGIVSHWFLIIISLFVVFIIIYLMFVSNKKLEKFAYFVIIIGAISNILDRTINTFVVDFISIHYTNYYWPAFNLADIYITIGVIMLIMSFFRVSKENK
tara:strand:- start:632 stop:1084 length:453 start_codon:yes stop_codon:yes gene_type:complete